MNKISIIIPLYNKKEYIQNCINSIQNQTYSNFEIIVVDDESTDNSLELVKKLEDKDKRIKVISKSHSGVSMTRNLGIQNATGDYIVFVDADDEIKSSYLAELIKYKKYDLVVSGLIKRYIDKNNKKEELTLDDIIINDPIKNNSIIFNRNVFPLFSVNYTKLFKSQIIKKNKISFPNQPYGEDSLFVLQYLKNCNSVRCISYNGYINNIIPSTLSRRHIDNIEKYLIKINQYAQKNYKLEYSSAWQYLWCRLIKITLENEIENYGQFKSKCILIRNKEESSHISFSKIVGMKDKIFIMLFKIRAYGLLYKLYLIK